MATLYVEKVPDDLYEALRQQAKKKRKSVAAEVIEMLHDCVPTKAQLKRRADFLRSIQGFQAREPLAPGPFPSAEEMIREDRER
jgi:plasmid stability protein